MKIERIIGMTRDIGKPQNWNEATMGPCESLPVRDEVIGNANCMISAHTPDAADLAKLAAGEPLLLGIYGTVHPVIFMTVGYSPEYKAAFKAEFEAQADHIPNAGKMVGLPDDVVELVVAARIVAFEDQSEEALRRLDKASEAFASRVPWENDPNDEVADDAD